MINLSVIIPSRNSGCLQKTIDDLLTHAETEIEIIVVCDGYWPDPPIKTDPRVVIIHHGTFRNSPGMRASINAGMAVAKGQFVMKIDEHCSVGQDYDKILAADCDDNMVVVPRRYRLDVDNWKIFAPPIDNRPPVDYMYLAYPYKRLHDMTSGLYGEEWRQKYYDRKDVMIDNLMACQGSCYFMTKKHWDRLGPLDDTNYGPFNHEAQEIFNKTWLGGGRCVVNKNTFYAHLHKGSKHGKGYGFSNEQYRFFMESKDKSRRFCRDYWINNKWPERVHDWEWLVEKFWPIPTWPDNWETQIINDQREDRS